MFADRQPKLVPGPRSLDQGEHATFAAALMKSQGMKLHRSTVVDVACTQPSVDAYSGDVRLRQSVELKFGDFVAYYQAKQGGSFHWLMEAESDLQFYLAQCPLYSTSADVPAVLPNLLPCCAALKPPVLDTVDVTQINLWMTVAPSDTSVHYDAYENILHVVEGSKRVRLYPPSATPAIQPHAIYSKSSNHTILTLEESKALPDFVEFNVDANTALYIPEGWWHQVHSASFTVAVNYWFDGMRSRLLAQPTMVPYYARVVVEDLVRSARLDAMKDAVDQSRHRLLQRNLLAQDPYDSFLLDVSFHGAGLRLGR
ncbi:hypothetical protein, variant 1 [Aphanomyces invadans]|uniref:JmjC domain-containing protein n=1 Tax=Aphanomyces invadans TaxID=157072 RepID=A0A024U5K3_9STRA|nr:hypothetical protein, variant 1 [Aphanomyces invadans]ETW00878.1 hypothetical protein, variant 1 [Aphanomyces invadans]|eukprot:XP_008871013.1 hypothetical protein, variant 1 [Aphanomyces invadans]